MSEGSEVACRGILDLPAELHYEILQHSRPDDFEALMLTCKRIYAAGVSLIPDHEFCKTHLLGSKCFKTGHSFIIDVCFAYLLLAKVPRRRGEPFLGYVKRVEWSAQVWSKTDGFTPTEIMKKISSHAPWLKKQLMKIYASLVGLGFFNYQLFPTVLDSPDTIESQALNSYSKITCHEILGTSLLLLLHNLQSLILRIPPVLVGNEEKQQPALPAIIDKHGGQIYFQQLRELHLQAQRIAPYTLNNLAPFLLLPKLKTLIVGELEGYENSHGLETPIQFQWPYGDKVSGLEKLVLFEADAEPECIANFLKPLKSLRTFIWEDNTMQPESYGDELEFETNFQLNKEFWEEFWDPIIYDSEDEEGDQSNEDAPLTEWEAALGENTRTWNPTGLLNEVLIHKKDTLEHLALTIAIETDWHVVRRRHQIANFKDFTKLTHLEIDTSILNTRKGVKDDWYERGIPFSLTDIFPPCIQVVRLVIPYARYIIINCLLRKIPKEKERFPDLRKILLILDEPSITDSLEFYHVELRKRFNPMRDEFSKVGVELELECLQFGGVSLKGPRADVDKEGQPKGRVSDLKNDYFQQG